MWARYRRALRLDDRIAFDRLLFGESRSAACGMMPASDEFEPALLSMLVDLNEVVQSGEGALR